MAHFKYDLLVVIVAAAAGLSGCGAAGDEPAPTKGGGPASQEPLPLNVVQVELRNLSSAAVDVQLYATDATTNGLSDGLFVPDHQVKTGIGNAATGILAPGETDQIAYPCSDRLVIGTAGGQFLDPNLGSPLGRGSPRFVQSRYQFDCGATLVFEYNQTAGGYTTHIFEPR